MRCEQAVFGPKGKVQRTLLEVLKRLNHNLRLDLPPRREVERLDRVLAVPDVRADDAQALEDGPKDVGFDVGVGREANCDERAVRTEVFEGVVVGCTAGGGDDGGLWTSPSAMSAKVREAKPRTCGPLPSHTRLTSSISFPSPPNCLKSMNVSAPYEASSLRLSSPVSMPTTR